jgi:hypothetical protein
MIGITVFRHGNPVCGGRCRFMQVWKVGLVASEGWFMMSAAWIFIISISLLLSSYQISTSRNKVFGHFSQQFVATIFYFFQPLLLLLVSLKLISGTLSKETPIKIQVESQVLQRRSERVCDHHLRSKHSSLSTRPTRAWNRSLLLLRLFLDWSKKGHHLMHHFLKMQIPTLRYPRTCKKPIKKREMTLCLVFQVSGYLMSLFYLLLQIQWCKQKMLIVSHSPRRSSLFLRLPSSQANLFVQYVH